MFQVKMKVIFCLAALVAIAIAYPVNEGAAYTNEAILQARNSHLIPQGAQIQKVNIQNMHFVSINLKAKIINCIVSNQIL